jgi:hypothetical protein
LIAIVFTRITVRWLSEVPTVVLPKQSVLFSIVITVFSPGSPLVEEPARG